MASGNWQKASGFKERYSVSLTTCLVCFPLNFELVFLLFTNVFSCFVLQIVCQKEQDLKSVQVWVITSPPNAFRMQMTDFFLTRQIFSPLPFTFCIIRPYIHSLLSQQSFSTTLWLTLSYINFQPRFRICFPNFTDVCHLEFQSTFSLCMLSLSRHSRCLSSTPKHCTPPASKQAQTHNTHTYTHEYSSHLVYLIRVNKLSRSLLPLLIYITFTLSSTVVQ